MSVEDKLTVICHVDRGETLNTVFLDYGVSVNGGGCDWKRNRQKLEQFFKSQIGDCISMKTTDFPFINEATICVVPTTTW